MKRLPYLTLLFVLLSPLVHSAPRQPDTDLILDRYRTLVLEGHSGRTEEALALAATLDEQGTWPDIDYFRDSRSSWPSALHLRNLLVLAVALAENPQDATAAQIRQAFDRGLGWWTTERPRAPNWWWNEIGGPQTMRDILVLTHRELSPSQREAAMDYLAQHNVRGTGANLVWSAELALHHGCLSSNSAQIKKAVDLIWNEIEVGAPEGVQEDWSFFQHDQRLQSFHYGNSFQDVTIRLAWQLRGTEWALPLDKATILARCALDGQRWMCRGIYNSPAGVDRAVARGNGLYAADRRQILRKWLDVVPEAFRESTAAFIDAQEAGLPGITGHKHFRVADFTSYPKEDATILLKTVSSRTFLTETINGENLKGYPYISCGDHYVLRTGHEYEGLQPVWNWARLPGLTTGAYVSWQERTDFVGGISDGEQGVTAMDYLRSNGGNKLGVRKLWAFHDGVMLCLLGGWDASNTWSQIVTSLEQCRVQGEIAIGMDGEAAALDPATQAALNVEWVYHNGIGYLPLGGGTPLVQMRRQTGSWRDINRDYAPDIVSEDVLNVALEHGPHPAPAAYAIVTGRTQAEVAALAASQPWQILRNDRSCQAVRFDDGTVMAAFYEAGELDTERPIRVNRPCIVLDSPSEIRICDPAQNGGPIELQRGSEILDGYRLPPDGEPLLIKFPR